MIEPPWRTRFTRLLVLLLGIGCGGCAGGAVPDGWVEEIMPRHDGTEWPSPVADELLSGFDPVDPAGLQQGDRVLFGVALKENGLPAERWYLRITAREVDARRDDNLSVVVWARRSAGSWTPHPGFSGSDALSVVDIELFDAAGGLVAAKFERVAVWHLEQGLANGCRAALRGGDLPQAELQKAEAEVALAALFAVVRAHDELREILARVLRTPSWWSIVSGLGVDLEVRPSFDAVSRTPVTGQVAPLSEGWHLPFVVSGNGEPMLLGSLLLVPPQSPRALSAGVVSIVAGPPDDTETWLGLHLLAARRGSDRAQPLR